MKKFFTKKSIAVIVIAAVIALISVVTLVSGGSGSDAITRSENAVMRPIKTLVTSFLQSLENIYGYMYRYDMISAENERLKVEIADLEQKYRDYTAISAENEELKQLLKFSSKHSDYVYEPATIISWTASNWTSTFTVGKGENSGIRVGDSVVTEYGYLVGQVTELGSTTATVTTVLDTSSSIGALVYSSSESAVAQGDLRLLRDGRLKLSYLSDNASVATGDTIITSGKGGKFPQGLVIGYVADVYKTSAGLADYASVTPAADIGALTHVYIITGFEIAE